MLIPLKSVQFATDMRICGKALNKIVDPSVRDKGVDIYATDIGVVVSIGGAEALVPWANVASAQAEGGYGFVAAFDDIRASKKGQ